MITVRLVSSQGGKCQKWRLTFDVDGWIFERWYENQHRISMSRWDAA